VLPEYKYKKLNNYFEKKKKKRKWVVVGWAATPKGIYGWPLGHLQPM
jgi:hypothetical protein